MTQIESLLQYISKGGFMMYPLLISEFVALVIIIEKFLLLQKKLYTPSSRKKDLLAMARNGDWGRVQAAAQNEKSPALQVLALGLQDPSAPIDEVEIRMQNEAEMWVPIAEKRLEWLDTIITAAPLMGLLGTITGMMGSFQVLSEKGVNEPHAITGGVAEALIATATGLIIALLTLLAYNFLNQKVKNLIFEMESMASQVIEMRKRKARQA